MDTTPTPDSSEQVPAVLIEPVSPAAKTQITEVTLSANPEEPATDQVLFIEIGIDMKTSLLFRIPTSDELATFIWTNYIIHKMSDHQSFLCREQFLQQFYRNLVSFFQINLHTTNVSYFQLDNLIIAALHFLGFD